MKEYQKIPGPYRRHVDGPLRNKLIEGEWTSPELEQTAGLDWVWTEKVDGTNIRIGWDGHKISYGGRTDNAQIPAKLIAVLDSLVSEEMFEQEFTGGEAVTLYGEGYGAGIHAARAPLDLERRPRSRRPRRCYLVRPLWTARRPADRQGQGRRLPAYCRCSPARIWVERGRVSPLPADPRGLLVWLGEQPPTKTCTTSRPPRTTEKTARDGQTRKG